jgi:N-acetylglucosamine kinase-like BadF-type ATPase
MSKTYYLAADGGGSKLQAILYDESYRVIRTGRVAGVNTLYKPAEVVRDNLEGMMKALLHGDGGEEPVTRLTAADLCMIGSGDVMRDILSRLDYVGEITFHSEPVVGLAACLKTEGAVALSGTGSDAFFVKDGTRVQAVGGWGPLLGDEGSGYDIGLQALKAAIYSYDGRKEKSMLYDLVMENWSLENLWGIVTHLAGNPDARHEVASAAKLCAKAAHAGDRTALRIYEHAALEMFLQLRTVIEQHREEWDGTAVVMGGAWKGHPRMFEVFKREVSLLFPEAVISLPLYEPVVGCAVLRGLKEGRTLTELDTLLANGFKQFQYH